MSNSTKRRLSLFSFGGKKSDDEDTKLVLTNTNLSEKDPLRPSDRANSSSSYGSPSKPINKNVNASSTNDQIVSPVQSPDSMCSTNTNAASLIFERSVQDPLPISPSSQHLPKCGKCAINNKQCTHNSSINLSSQFNQEDYIPPVLDASTAILHDQNTDLDSVEMVYPRRNSSVIGLSMALGGGRPPTSRKNSILSSPLELHAPAFPITAISEQEQSNPTSPSKLQQSKSTLSFYSYADMINNDEYSRRPSVTQSLSNSFINGKGRTNSFSRVQFNRQASISRSVLSQQIRSNSTHEIPHLNRTTSSNGKSPMSPSQPSNLKSKKFMISPDTSDSENEIDPVGDVSSTSPNNGIDDLLLNKQISLSSDIDSLVSSSVGETLRKYTSEIRSN